MAKILTAEQSPDQAGYRQGYSCDDHLFAITMIAEICNEFNLPLWAAALDFKKALGTISHASIWDAMIAQKIPAAYIDVLSRLYEGQHATVRCDAESRRFNIERGTKQGDPISPLLFNAVLEQIMRRVQ